MYLNVGEDVPLSQERGSNLTKKKNEKNMLELHDCSKWITVISLMIHFSVCSTIVLFSAMDFANFSKANFTSELFKIIHYDKWPKLMKMLDKNTGKELIEDGYVKMSQILAILIVILCGPISMLHSNQDNRDDQTVG
ncbi:hypothetical protein APICC_07725 [Apis cerana cerana]|uniref:Uncharacterized protein n=1 Tax=Apis cerana cerana TaxID=94128 RepID=A0A2A3EI73_APICC|nr:hypothetical protein APICC_07725 [Apis cerana cerana]